MHELRVYASALGASVFHYRTERGRDEIDCIVERFSGEWVCFVIKLGSDSEVDAEVGKLRRAEGNMARPTANLVVITARGIVETRTAAGKTPVRIIPLGAIGA